MDITLRIYTKEGNHNSSRTIMLNEGELDDMIGGYLRDEEYLKNSETLESISYEDIKL
jgi:formate dehydrogenase assembly factor FdhD